ncbi:MAG: tRNA (adenosine(37)-N6)-threonylcarbamoyltransferase complex ATPase subunit type 1 TsaE [Pirellulaceae bacterium]
MTEFTFDAASEADTDRLGAALAEVVPDGTVVGLSGTLGAGKTRLVQGVAAACGLRRDEVVSPTFVLCQSYRAARALHHMDAYRIKDDDEFLQLGPEEYFDSDAVTFVEWAERVADCLPPERIEIHVEVTGEQSRRFRISAAPDALQPVVNSLAERLN